MRYSTERQTLKIGRIMATGIVALSFAKRVVEPNPVNKLLAAEVDRIDDELQQGGEPTIIVSQWEIALAYDANYVVGPEYATVKGNGKEYLDSKDVLKRAFEAFETHGVTDVIVVANPFLHLGAVRSMVRKAGFTVMKVKISWVGFDNSSLNLQWWCKGWPQSILYAGLQVLGKAIRKDFHGIGEKPAQP
jgi:hypothetical protein